MAKIRIFSQPTCPACNEVKEFLKNKGIEFDDQDVTKDRNALKEMVQTHKVRVTPLIIIGEKKIIGFNPVELEKALAENK
jgi:glutaredoxin-like YruB-family protein